MSDESGFVHEVMTKVINGTHQAIETMERENQVVNNIHLRLPQVNVSGAGNNLAKSIGEWSQSYGVIVGLLKDLNGRAIYTRDTMTDAAALGEQVSNR